MTEEEIISNNVLCSLSPLATPLQRYEAYQIRFCAELASLIFDIRN